MPGIVAGVHGAAHAEVVAQIREAVSKAVATAASELGDAQPPAITIEAFSGFPAQSLINASQGADLIVVGSRGAGGFEHLVLGSISDQLARHSSGPVVIVPSAR